MKQRTQAGGDLTIKSDALRQLAWFRYRVRCFLRFSEKAARTCGITPRHIQRASERAVITFERINSAMG